MSEKREQNRIYENKITEDNEAERNEPKTDFVDKHEMGEDVTKYGEFVCSAYHWLFPEAQKKRTKRFEDITSKNQNTSL